MTYALLVFSFIAVGYTIWKGAFPCWDDVRKERSNDFFKMYCDSIVIVYSDTDENKSGEAEHYVNLCK